MGQYWDIDGYIPSGNLLPFAIENDDGPYRYSGFNPLIAW